MRRAGRVRFLPRLKARVSSEASDDAHVPLDEEAAGTEDVLLEEAAKKEQAQQLRSAVAQLPELDREIICRFYDLCQPAPEIAAALGLSPAAVRMRLMRSRETIKTELCRGGFAYEQH